MSESTKAAVIVGGSSGIGLAIGKKLISDGYMIEILDICEPDPSAFLPIEKYRYTYCNLTDYDKDLFYFFSCDESINALVITAGIGRLCSFENLHVSEISKTMQINAEAPLKIISAFYHRIKSEKLFYTCIMGSIAGLVSSPLFSVYSASKAAVCRFCESLNAELAASGIKNRILNVSPGSIKGTRFNGGKNDFSLLEHLAQEITEKLFKSDEIYIPDYEQTYKKVIERYNDDSEAFGLQSYEYKKDSGRLKDEKRVIIGYLSGTFDLFHVGHLNLLRRAKRQCDYLIVGVHESGAWKGKETFISLKDRMEIVGACKYVDKVVVSEHEDCDAWDKYHYSKLFVGSDYKGSERFKRYEKVLKGRAEIVYFPYTKGVSSSDVRDEIKSVIEGGK